MTPLPLSFFHVIHSCLGPRRPPKLSPLQSHQSPSRLLSTFHFVSLACLPAAHLPSPAPDSESPQGRFCVSFMHAYLVVGTQWLLEAHVWKEHSVNARAVASCGRRTKRRASVRVHVTRGVSLICREAHPKRGKI